MGIEAVHCDDHVTFVVVTLKIMRGYTDAILEQSAHVALALLLYFLPCMCVSSTQPASLQQTCHLCISSPGSNVTSDEQCTC